jgi:hypothetical protein
MNLNAMLAAINPLIKPAINDLSKDITDSIENTQEQLQLADDDVVYIIFVRNDKPVIAPAIVDSNNNIRFSDELNETLFQPQPLDKFILDAFNKNKNNK